MEFDVGQYEKIYGVNDEVGILLLTRVAPMEVTFD